MVDAAGADAAAPWATRMRKTRMRPVFSIFSAPCQSASGSRWSGRRARWRMSRAVGTAKRRALP